MRFRLACIILIIALFTGTAFADFIGQAAPATLDVVSATESSIQLLLTVPGMELRSLKNRGRTWDVVGVMNAGTTSDIGEPALPLITRLVRLGSTSGVIANYEILESQQLEGLNIFPYQKAPLRNGTSWPFAISESVYMQNALLPNAIVTIGEPGIIHGVRLAPVILSPLQYNPFTGDAVLVKKARITLDFQGQNTRNTLSDRSPKPTHVFSQLLDRQLINTTIDRDTYTDFEPEDGEYMIITGDAFLDYAEQLAAWKEQKGLPVSVYTATEAGSTAQEIKQFITDRYYKAGEPPLDYVLLIGDIQQIPTFFGIGYCPADHIYTTLEGDDYWADIIIGRLSVQTADEAEIAVGKMLDYETDPYLGQTDWYSAALTVSGSDMDDDQNATVCGEMCETYGDFDQVDYFFQSNGGNTGLNVSSALNEGRSWVSYFGHGWEQGWSSTNPSFDNGDVIQLTNSGKLPVITSIACANAAFDSANDCFAETWIKNARDRGAAGIFAASRNTPFFYTDILGQGVARGYFIEGMDSFGAACFFGKMHMYKLFPEAAGGQTEEVMHHFHVFADPELGVWSAVPEDPTVAYPETITVGEDDYAQVTVQFGPVFLKHALVHLYRDGEFSVTGRTNTTGNATLKLPDDLTAGEIQLVVTGRNALPFFATIEAVMPGADDDDDNDATDDDDDNADDDDDSADDDDDDNDDDDSSGSCGN